jgi:hypothetical protein
MKPKLITFAQTKNEQILTESFSKTKKQLPTTDDASVYYMLADITCPTKHLVHIEKVSVDVFKNKKYIEPIKDLDSIVETLDIMSDKELMNQIKLSKADVKRGKTIPWEKIK